MYNEFELDDFYLIARRCRVAIELAIECRRLSLVTHSIN